MGNSTSSTFCSSIEFCIIRPPPTATTTNENAAPGLVISSVSSSLVPSSSADTLNLQQNTSINHNVSAACVAGSRSAAVRQTLHQQNVTSRGGRRRREGGGGGEGRRGEGQQEGSSGRASFASSNLNHMHDDEENRSTSFPMNSWQYNSNTKNGPITMPATRRGGQPSSNHSPVSPQEQGRQEYNQLSVVGPQRRSHDYPGAGALPMPPLGALNKTSITPFSSPAARSRQEHTTVAMTASRRNRSRNHFHFGRNARNVVDEARNDDSIRNNSLEAEHEIRTAASSYDFM